MKGWLTWDDRLADMSKAGALAKQDRNGVPLPADAYPTVMYPDTSRERRRIAKIPYVNVASLSLVLNADCAEIFRAHDMGQGNLYPVRIVEGDRKTPIEGEYFSLNIGNVKNTCLVEQSPGLRRFSPGGNVWSQSPFLDDSYPTEECFFSVSPAALEGPDFWVQTDPIITSNFFMSDRLAQALKAKKMLARFRAFKARVV